MDGWQVMGKIQTASFVDSLRFNLSYVFPYFLRGIFIKDRFWNRVLEAIHPDPLGVKLCQRLRARYRTGFIRVNLVTRKALLVFDQAGIWHVLDHSPYTYADPEMKRRGMSHFQANALTISRGEAWQDRRRFNEAVLSSKDVIPTHADRFLAIVARETSAVLASKQPFLTWEDFDRLFKWIALQVIFGVQGRPSV
jgi:hypothetical protein